MVKKKKKPKLTKEERKARRLAKREAARLRKEQREIQARKDQLDRETKATEMNAVVITRKWRDLMRRARAPQLYDDFVALRLRTERLIDMKSAMIDELVDALDVANDQHNTSLQHHVETIDKLIDFYHSQMGAASGRYRVDLAALGAMMSEQKEAVQRREQHDQDHLEVVLFATKDWRREESVQRKAEITVRIDEETDKNAEAYHVMQTGLEGALERCWKELCLTLQQHAEGNAERRAAVARLMAKERAEHQVIAEQKRRTRQLHRQVEEGLEFMRAWDTSDLSGHWAELHALRHERQELRDAYDALRDAMDAEKLHDKRQLKLLVVESEASQQRLQQVHKQGERILSLACLCRNLEADGERTPLPGDAAEDGDEEYWVLGAGGRGSGPDNRGASMEPMAGSSVLPRLQSSEDVGEVLAEGPVHVDTSSDEEEDVDLLEETLSSLDGLSAFWSRVGAAEVARRQVRSRVSRLRDENLQLRAHLREYLRCVAPSWCGPEPEPRGPPALPVYEPALAVRGTTPWRGARHARWGADHP